MMISDKKKNKIEKILKKTKKISTSKKKKSVNKHKSIINIDSKKVKKTTTTQLKGKKDKIVDNLIIEVPRSLDVDVCEFEDSKITSTNTFGVDLSEEKKKRRGRNKKDKIYFSKKTEEAIISYNKETCITKRNEIYENQIKFSFEKLVENIFNTFKFTYFDNSPLEIQKETVSHLVSNIHKFQSGKGKAFSYFSIVAKNYLIFHNNTNYKRYNQHVDISETPSEDSVCLQTEDNHHKQVQNKELMNLLIEYWEKNINRVFTKSKDLHIANAVVELYRNCDRIENFNKKTLYLYIRELSNCKTQQITKILNKMNLYQKQLLENYMNVGSL